MTQTQIGLQHHKIQYINSLLCQEFDPTACIIVQSSYSCPAYWLQNCKESLFIICNITFLWYVLRISLHLSPSSASQGEKVSIY